MSVELKKRVDDYASSWNVASTYKKLYEVSTIGQNYAVLATKGAWYKVRVFAEIAYPRLKLHYDPTRHRGLPGERPFYESEHLTAGGADGRIEEIRNLYKQLNAQKAVKDHFMKCFQYEVPKDWGSNPDKYLSRGDVLMSWFVHDYVHAGIYVGNGKVIHMSGHGGGKAAGVVREGNLIGDFVHKSTDDIFVMAFSVRIRSGEEIARTAEGYAEKNFRKGEYNLMNKNCQHFVTLCATGVEFIMFDGLDTEKPLGN